MPGVPRSQAGSPLTVNVMAGSPSQRMSLAPERPRGGELNAAIARGVVRSFAQSNGRGPARARAFFHANVVVVMLESPLTRGEQTLAAAGRSETVLETRRAVQAAMRGRLVGLVEEVTGCSVRALLGDSHLEPDLVATVFVLDRPVPG